MAQEILQSREDIFRQFRDSLAGRITKLTNFTDRSFNALFTQAFSQEIRNLQELTLASELAGFIEYAGGPVDEDDLEELGIDGQISVDGLNELLQDQQLDEFVKIVGVTREPGAAATGRVTFETGRAQTDIPEGTLVTTAPTDDQQDFLTQETVSTAQGETFVREVDIESTEIGVEGNVPADTITRINNPPVGVRGVTNPEATTGGEDVETNDELRERAKTAVGGASEGGTVQGIKTFITNEIKPVRQGDVILDEFTSQKPPFVDVIVDGGLDSEVTSAIEFSRPAGIRHNLVRPQVVQIGADLRLVGTNIDTADVNDNVEEFLFDLGIGEELFQDQLIREIMLSNDDIINIDDLGTVIERSTNETFNFESGRLNYRLDYTYEKENGSILVQDDSTKNYVEGTDFSVIDRSGDGFPETIQWDTNELNPKDGTEFRVDYDVTVPGVTKTGNEYKTRLKRDELFTFSERVDTFDFNNTTQTYPLESFPFEDKITLVDEDGTQFVKDESWQLAPIGDAATSDTFTFSNSQDVYSVSEDFAVVEGDVTSDCKCAITDDDRNIFKLGFDYETIDTDGDGFDDAINWATGSGTTPADGVDFEVNYNGFKNTVRWDQSGSVPVPPQDNRVTVTYTQQLYLTELEIVETLDRTILDRGGDVYNEDVDYDIVDVTQDGELDAIRWLSQPGTLSLDEDFFLTYVTEGDVLFSQREKADPGTITSRQA